MRPTMHADRAHASNTGRAHGDLPARGNAQRDPKLIQAGNASRHFGPVGKWTRHGSSRVWNADSANGKGGGGGGGGKRKPKIWHW